jgi:fatty acid amide hydrolase
MKRPEETIDADGDRQRYREYKNERDRNGGAGCLRRSGLPALRHGSSFFLSHPMSYSALFNLLGMPAGVVAATRVRAVEESDREQSIDIIERAARKVEKDSAGLPVGVQVVARHWREDVALSIMRALEEHFKTEDDYPSNPSAV